ncbi:hypothetical protein [Burkholderia perseverans]|uniref:hypothetical protein n=1 Tax=Burkholderia perseverans TaxID=2615214 RepID=UPI001FF04166|nr:hypothetical protein [Burkholderia perseverans]
MPPRNAGDPARKSFALRVPLDYIVRRSRAVSVAARPGKPLKPDRARDGPRPGSPAALRVPGERCASRIFVKTSADGIRRRPFIWG